VAENTSNKYDILLYLTQKNKYEYTTKMGKEVIDKAITLYFCGDDGKDSTALSKKWVKTTVATNDGGEVMYFYYKDVLQSGATTAPLLNAVKLNDDFIYDIYEASFDLNVVNLSTQAYKESAQTVFGASDKSFDADKVYSSVVESSEDKKENENGGDDGDSQGAENGENVVEVDKNENKDENNEVNDEELNENSENE
jgi:hypothetical protein